MLRTAVVWIGGHGGQRVRIIRLCLQFCGLQEIYLEHDQKSKDEDPSREEDEATRYKSMCAEKRGVPLSEGKGPRDGQLARLLKSEGRSQRARALYGDRVPSFREGMRGQEVVCRIAFAASRLRCQSMAGDDHGAAALAVAWSYRHSALPLT